MAYTILEVNSTGASIGGESTSDSETSLSTSSTSRLQNAFPNRPQHTDSDGPPGPGSYNLGRTSYRQYYESEVLGGNNEGYEALSLGGTSHSRNYSENGPPDLSDLTIVGEPPHKTPTSTIVNSGLGPNVNVGPAMELLGWQVTQGTSAPLEGTADEYVYGIETLTPAAGVFPKESTALESSLPFVGDGSASPSSTSTGLSESSLHLLPPGDSKLNYDGS